MKYQCRCCENYTLPMHYKDAIGYICPICNWENDVFVLEENEPSDCNKSTTLHEARLIYKNSHK